MPATTRGWGPYGISSRMIAAYHDYDWPGNVAELRAVIESAVSTAALARFRGRVLPDSFCAICFDGDRSGRSFKEVIREVERSILENTLHRVGGNQAHAARILQLNATTLHEKLKRHGMLRAFRQRDAPSPVNESPPKSRPSVPGPGGPRRSAAPRGLYPPRLMTTPASAPVACPSSIAIWPLTSTQGIPLGGPSGFMIVELSSTRS